MSHTAFVDSLIIVGVVVAIVAAWAALPHPAVGEGFRKVAKSILFVAAAWIIVAIVLTTVAPLNDKPGSTDTTDTSTAPLPKPVRTVPPTITYPPAPEPVTPSTSGVTQTDTETHTSPQQPVSKREAKIPPQPPEGERIHKEAQDEPAKLPQDKWTLKRNALLLMERGDWPNAISAWTTWITTFSGSDKKADRAAYLQLGIAYEKQQDWSHAIHVLERANVLTTDNDTNALLHLGRCYERVQRWPDALKVYEEVLRNDPGNALASHGQAVARRYLPR